MKNQESSDLRTSIRLAHAIVWISPHFKSKLRIPVIALLALNLAAPLAAQQLVGQSLRAQLTLNGSGITFSIRARILFLHQAGSRLAFPPCRSKTAQLRSGISVP